MNRLKKVKTDFKKIKNKFVPYLIYDSQFFYVDVSSFALCKSSADLKKIKSHRLNKEQNYFLLFSAFLFF